jgi:hypothetical protein
MDDRQPSLGLPSGHHRNLANTTNPTTINAASPRQARLSAPMTGSSSGQKA